MNTDKFVETLAANRLRPGPMLQFDISDRPATVAEAYDVQDALHDVLAKSLGPQVGHKVGCTSKAMQEFMNISNPAAGGMFADTVFEGEVRKPYTDYHRVGAECEIAVTLAKDISPTDGPFTRDSVADYVEACHAAMELVDERYADWRALDLETMIADDFFQAGAVLGPAVTNWRDLDLGTVQGKTLVNGEVRGAGTGADILGHPLEVLAWLATHKAARGQSLKAGEIILLGSMVQVQYVSPGDMVVVDVGILGSVTAEFTD